MRSESVEPQWECLLENPKFNSMNFNDLLLSYFSLLLIFKHNNKQKAWWCIWKNIYNFTHMSQMFLIS